MRGTLPFVRWLLNLVRLSGQLAVLPGLLAAVPNSTPSKDYRIGVVIIIRRACGIKMTKARCS